VARLIRNIVFDIGWVLVRLNYRPILGHLKAHGAEVGPLARPLGAVYFAFRSPGAP